jgi:hypothetical protein
VTPYSLIHLNEAITDIQYELWHYSVEGHAGHSTERGIPQALFYLNWLVTEGVGYSVAVLALIGIAISWLPLKQHATLLIVLLGFPLGYSALMIMQKTNFTRNMVAVVPYVGIFAGLGLAAATRSLRSASLSGPIALLIGALSLYPLVFSDIDYLQRSSKQFDSRTELVTWLKTARSPSHDVAISGDLQLPIQTFSLPGVDAFNPDKTSISDLFNAGYSYVVFSHQEQLSLPAPNNFFSLVKEIPGDPQSTLRIPRNPPITIAFFDPSTPQGTVENAIEAKKRVAISLTNPARLGCERGEEPHCWISSRATEISLAKDTPELPNGVITLTMTTPWEAQEVSITSQKSPSTSVKFPLPVGQHHTIELPLAAFPLTVTLTQIHSPEGQGVSGDTRRLGVTLAR